MKILGLLLVTIFTAVNLSSQTLETRTYTSKTKKETITHRFEIKIWPEKKEILLHSKGNNKESIQHFLVDSKWDTQSWSYLNKANSNRMKGIRVGQEVEFSGTYKGKEIKKTFNLKSYPWNQVFHMGLETFIGSKEKKYIFWAIGTRGRGATKISRFKAKKKSKKNQIQHVTISLTGILSMFWRGHYYFRLKDNIFIKYKGNDGPGTAQKEIRLTKHQIKNQ